LGAWEKIAGLLASGTPPDGARAAYLALRHARRRGRVVEFPAALGQLRGDAKHAPLIAHLATALGRPTRAREVEEWARGRQTQPSYAASARAFLESQGFVVVSVVGDAAAGDAVLAAGLPFLLYRVLRTGREYREVPVLVRGFDRRTGLWLLVEPDGHRLDVVPREFFEKARLLCAVPQERKPLLEPFLAAPASQRGRAVEAALEEADHGRHEAAVKRVKGETPVEQVYRAFLLYRRAVAGLEPPATWQVREPVERSWRHHPRLGFEAYVRGKALSDPSEAQAALEAFDNVVHLEGPSATVAAARSVPYHHLGLRLEVLASVTEAQRLAPLDLGILVLRAFYRALEGDPEGARGDLRRALDREPDELSVAWKLADLEITAGRPEEALAVLQETLRRIPDAAETQAEVVRKVRVVRRKAERRIIERAGTVAAMGRVLRSSEAETRILLAHELGDLEDTEPDAAESMLRGLLADESAQVRIKTLRVFRREPWLRRRIEKDGVFARRIAGLLAKDAEPAVRAVAAALLARVDIPLAARALAAALTGEQADPEVAVRVAAAGAISIHSGPGVQRALVAALEDPHEDVRAAAIAPLFVETATTQGFEPDDPPEARAEAVAKWKDWLEKK